MTTPQLRLTQPEEMPAAPVIDNLTATVLNEAVDALAALRTRTGSATPPCTCTP